MNVLSLFDGMSCGQISLEKAEIKVDNYFSSEIDKHAIKVTQDNYPNTIQLGDISEIKGKDLPKIDLLIGGSPCQGFSFAGKQLNFEDPRSKLFFEYVRLLKETNPKYFLLENVFMSKKNKDIITNYLGVSPFLINSSLLSAQNRKRLYWTNIYISPIQEKKITFGDIREFNVENKNLYYSEKALQWIKRHEIRKNKKLRIWSDNTKVQSLEATMAKKYSSQRFFGIPDTEGLRYISPLECERSQTVPDNYTNCVSNTQRYTMLGNGWTVDVVVHILKGIKK